MLLAVGPYTLARLAGRPEVVAEFPFLAALARPARSGCGGCGAAEASDRRVRAAADVLFSLSPARKAKFKQVADVSSVTRRVVRAGRVVTESF